MYRILVLNGPNLNLLGVREPAIYGTASYAALTAFIDAAARDLGLAVTIFQSNHEGALIDRIQAALTDGTDGIVINPAGYTHTSVALADAVKAVALPTVEVHLSDPDTREPFRRVSYVRAACIATVKGAGFEGYRRSLSLLTDHLSSR